MSNELRATIQATVWKWLLTFILNQILYTMKSEKDKNYRNLISKTAKSTNRSLNEVEDTMKGYFLIMAQAIQWDNPITIHMDYIGDLRYNQKWADKMKQINDNSNKA